jgi:hypothetical protein
MPQWTVPDWLAPLERLLEETGGEPLSTLMAYYGPPAISVLVQRQRDARALLANTQVRLLNKLRDAGLLVDRAAEAAKAEAAKPVPEVPTTFIPTEEMSTDDAARFVKAADAFIAAIPEDPIAKSVGDALAGVPMLLAERRLVEAFAFGVRATAPKPAAEAQKQKGPPLAPEDVE